MAKLIIEVEVQTYGENETAVLQKIAETVDKVVSLCDLSVGTFVTSKVQYPPYPTV